MEWIERLNQAMHHLEENLTEEIDYRKLGQIACCSSYHFQRMFAYMAGVSLAEYIRRRRMSRAAADLQSGEKVLDVALKYGYSSPTAFSRAFQTVHGVAPSAVKGEGVPVRAYPPLRFQMTIKGVEEMNYRIERKEAFRIVGKAWPLEQEIEKNFQSVPRMWQEVSEDGTLPRLAEKMDGQPMGLLGVCGCEDGEQWTYYIAVASSQQSGDFTSYTVPAATWAIFSGEGTAVSIQELTRRIVTEWLPTSGFEYGEGPDIEVYLNPDPANTRYEVWIPVVKK